MNIRRLITIAVAGATLSVGAYAATQATAAPSTSQQPARTTSTVAPPLDAVVVQAADEAALVQQCVAGQRDPDAHARYEATAAAHPALAQQLGADCEPTIVRP
jgi:hypothetical protein